MSKLFEKDVEQGPTGGVTANVPHFRALSPSAAIEGLGSLGHLLDVSVTVTVELGRTTMSIADLLKLGVGSVLEMPRSVNDPVDVVVQGVRIGRGEVVVVDDCFAVRLTEISEPRKRTPRG